MSICKYCIQQQHDKCADFQKREGMSTHCFCQHVVKTQQKPKEDSDGKTH